MNEIDMSSAGWAFMLGSCGLMIIWTAWCYYKVLTTPSGAERMHAPLDIATRDEPT